MNRGEPQWQSKQQSQRNKLMAEMREGEMTLAEIGAIFRISRQAVHQISKRQAADKKRKEES